ncbi:unnamed protein product [Brassicogethes aeneus]|uniref:DUF7869 domain-containing protein n=1 Tax=Brassicogethes aeneus TaxID=1431903 RepID=A0A9P0BAE7_BRAAE|nr:unnamed protein product [Brassicogethes aeneus]
MANENENEFLTSTTNNNDEEGTIFSDGDYSDVDIDYNPENENSSSDDSSENNENHPENANQIERQTGKKRVRRTSMWKRERAKKLRNEGKMYVDRKQKVHGPKMLREYNHRCRYNCNNNISEQNRQALFDDFWKLGSWELQTSFLNGAIALEPVKRKNQAAITNKNISCLYKLREFRVCKEFFMKTLDVSNKRIQNLVNKKKDLISGVSPRDKRGKKEPSNKISKERVDIIKEHINSFPRYSSHYSRSKHVTKKYLNPRLDLKTMYKLYVSFCQDVKYTEPVKESFYRHIFNTQFNLSFHRPNTDTCITCDKFQVIIDHENDLEVKRQAEIQKELHLRKAAAARQAKDEWHHNDDETKVAICFDLQKTMPTPNLSNSKAYYYRQLWTYNLNIHNLTTGNAQMFVWYEGQASRGCQEIASCLLKFIKTLPHHVKHITAFSDNCGGQNKSHIIVKFWLYIIKNTHIESVDHRFLISGHSYNECDQDFGLVELRKKKVLTDLYVPEHWANLIASSCRKFMVVTMQDEDFVNVCTLFPYFKKAVQGIRDMQWFHFEKKHPYTLFYKNNAASDIGSFSTIQMKSTRAGRNLATYRELSVVAEKPKIKALKYANLMELLMFVPPIYHDFFKNIPYENEPKRNEVQSNEDVDVNDDNVYSTDED